jgi:hypothetical protein
MLRVPEGKREADIKFRKLRHIERKEKPNAQRHTVYRQILAAVNSAHYTS